MKKTTKVPVVKKVTLKKEVKPKVVKAESTQVHSKSIQRREQAIQKEDEYSIFLEVNGITLQSTNKDLKDAIMSLDIKPAEIKTRGFFWLEFGGKKTNKVISVIPRTRRILTSEMTAYFFGKRMMSILKGVEELNIQ